MAPIIIIKINSILKLLLGSWISFPTGIKGRSFHRKAWTSSRPWGTTKAMMDDSLVRKTIAARPFFLAVSKSLELSTNLSISTLASGKTCGPAAGIAVTTCSRIRWTKLKFDNWQLIVKETCNIWINSRSVKVSEIKSHFLTKIKKKKGATQLNYLPFLTSPPALCQKRLKTHDQHNLAWTIW